MDASHSECYAGWYAWIFLYNMNGDGANLRYLIEREITCPSLYNNSTEWGNRGDAWQNETNHSKTANKILLASGNMYIQITGKSHSFICSLFLEERKHSKFHLTCV